MKNPLKTPEAKQQVRELYENVSQPLNLETRALNFIFKGLIKDWETPAQRLFREAQSRSRVNSPNYKV